VDPAGGLSTLARRGTKLPWPGSGRRNDQRPTALASDHESARDAGSRLELARGAAGIGPRGTRRRVQGPPIPGAPRRPRLNQSVKPSSARPLAVGVVELFVAVLIVGISCVNAAPPCAAWVRSHDPRFLLLASAQLALAALGLVWAWGQTPWNPPGWATAQLPALGLVLLVTLLFLATTLGPRRA
jgi:hypothetical protein